jgi:hypothetical protein
MSKEADQVSAKNGATLVTQHDETLTLPMVLEPALHT